MEKQTLSSRELELFCKGQTSYNKLVRIISSVLRDRYQEAAAREAGADTDMLYLVLTPELLATIEYEAVWLARHYQDIKNEKEG